LELSGCLALLQEIGKPAAEHRYFTGLMDHLASQIHSLLQSVATLCGSRDHRAMSKIPTLMAYSREGAGLYQVTVNGKRQSTAVAFLRPIKIAPT